MTYVVNFSLGSALFIGVTLGFYLRQKRIPNMQDKVFRLMLIACFMAAFFDFAAASCERYAESLPVALLYALNFLFLLSMHTCLPAFFVYMLFAAGRLRQTSMSVKLLIFTPYTVVTALLVASFFTRNAIFYVDESHIYRHGPWHILLYIVTFLYTLGMIYLIARYRRLYTRSVKNTVVACLAVTYVCTYIQMSNPYMLVTTTATTIGIMLMYYSVQSPRDFIDEETGAFNKGAMPFLVQEAIERGKDFTVLVISLPQYDALVRLFDSYAMTAIRQDMANFLQEALPRSFIVTTGGRDAVVICQDGVDYDIEAVQALKERLPDTKNTAGIGISAIWAVAAISSRGYRDAEELMHTLDYVRMGMGDRALPEVFVADEAFKLECEEYTKLSSTMDDCLENDVFVEAFKALTDSAGSPVALEAYLKLPGDPKGHARFAPLMAAAEQTGNASRFTLRLARAACTATKEGSFLDGNLRKVIMKLPTGFLMQRGAAQMLHQVTDELDVRPTLICFCIDKSAGTTEIATARENIDTLISYGFEFCLEGFGKGYTNMEYLMHLNLFAVKVDSEIVNEALSGKRQSTLLKGICGILSRMGCIAISDATLDEDAVKTVSALGVGLYCSGAEDGPSTGLA